MPDATHATILNLQRLSTEDGPGIRTTVFFKGCPLHCWWCHNPESIARHPQVQWLDVRCIGCELCLPACPNHALSATSEGAILVDREICQGCGVCAGVCPSTALEMLGEEISLDDLVSVLLKDKAYYEASGGGVTASGGEPTLQAAFVAQLFARLQAEGVHTALDTCGACSSQALDLILPYTDLVLYDFKLMDDAAHRRVTGLGNSIILDNLKYISRWIQENRPASRLWIRTPLIPGMTDGGDNLQGIAQYLNHTLNGLVARWELCAFNNLCRDKYRRLGLPWYFEETPLMTPAMLERCEQFARLGGFNPDRILVTGAPSAL